jgi:formylglycine-generating enzyme required for sulfatase activity
MQRMCGYLWLLTLPAAFGGFDFVKRGALSGLGLIFLLQSVLLAAGHGGAYVRSREGALVWDNYPQPGDEASWSGARDSQNYASGQGTLRWYKSGSFQSRYDGNMVQGKFDGIVRNEDADGKHYRGTFVNGAKGSDWGPDLSVTPTASERPDQENAGSRSPPIVNDVKSADEPRKMLQDAASSTRLASGYHAEGRFDNGTTVNVLSGDVAGDDYDLSLDSGTRVCKVNNRYWNSQDNGVHWQTAAVDDQFYEFIKAALRPLMRDSAGNQLDASRFVMVPSGTTDSAVSCVEVWVDPIPDGLNGHIPDNPDQPHYWIKREADGKKSMNRLKRKISFQGHDGTLDLRISQINEISLIQPAGEGEARAPYTVTTRPNNVLEVTVPGKKDTTAKSGETNSQLLQNPNNLTSNRENSLGLRFVPIGIPGVLLCTYDVRVKDFRKFVEATGYKANLGHGTTPSYAQTDDDPVVKVQWDDAKMFCDWLTSTEKQGGKLGPDEYYRLPTDSEWSTAVGLREDSRKFPYAKDGKVHGFYPWGTQWPPPKGAGNYRASISHDDFEYTSPVASFSPNKFGLYDMGGNVTQWCEDRCGIEYGAASYHVTRGGSYRSDSAEWCEASGRGNGNAGLAQDVGFRLVLSSHSEINLPEYRDTIRRNVQAEFHLIWSADQGGDASWWSEHFAPNSSYCYKNDGPASVDFIKADREKLIERWPTRDYTLSAGSPQFEIAPNQDAAVIRFAYTYKYSQPGKSVRGTANTILHLRLFPNGKWLITQYDEKVIPAK